MDIPVLTKTSVVRSICRRRARLPTGDAKLPVAITDRAQANRSGTSGKSLVQARNDSTYFCIHPKKTKKKTKKKIKETEAPHSRHRQAIGWPRILLVESAGDLPVLLVMSKRGSTAPSESSFPVNPRLLRLDWCSGGRGTRQHQRTSGILRYALTRKT